VVGQFAILTLARSDTQPNITMSTIVSFFSLFEPKS